MSMTKEEMDKIIAQAKQEQLIRDSGEDFLTLALAFVKTEVEAGRVPPRVHQAGVLIYNQWMQTPGDGQKPPEERPSESE